MPATIPSPRVGDVVEVGFVFRDKTNTLTSPTAVTVEVYDETGALAETFSQTDPRVTIGATIGTDLAAELGLTTAENTAGVGIVAVEITPDAAGQWQVYLAGTATAIGADTSVFTVRAKRD